MRVDDGRLAAHKLHALQLPAQGLQARAHHVVIEQPVLGLEDLLAHPLDDGQLRGGVRQIAPFQRH